MGTKRLFLNITPAWFCSEFLDQISNRILQKCSAEKKMRSKQQCSSEENRLFHEVPIELFWYKTIKYKYNSNYKGKANAWQLWRSISEISKYVQDYIHLLRLLAEEKEILFLTTGIELPRERDAWYQWYMQYLNLNVWDFRGISATSLFHRISGRVWPVSSISPSEFYHKTYDYLC